MYRKIFTLLLTVALCSSIAMAAAPLVLVSGETGYLPWIPVDDRHESDLVLTFTTPEGGTASVVMYDHQGVIVGRKTFDLSYAGSVQENVSSMISVAVPVGRATIDVSRGSATAFASVTDLRKGETTRIELQSLVSAAVGVRRRGATRRGIPSCSIPSLSITSSRSSICPNESFTVSWQASDPSAQVSIQGIGSGLPATGTSQQTASSAVTFRGSAANSCGTGPEATVSVSRVAATGSFTTVPAAAVQGSSSTISFQTSQTASWSLTSSLGNTFSTSSGTGDGTFTSTYSATTSGTDNITLNVTSRCSEVTTSSRQIAVTPMVQNQKTFNISAAQWQYDIEGTERISVKVGDRVTLRITATDVAHGFTMSRYVPSSLTIPSGATREVTFVADQAGTFFYFCTVECGLGHGSMNGSMIVNP